MSKYILPEKVKFILEKLKENNYEVDIDVNTIMMDISDNNIYIKYMIIDSKCEYEYKLEMSDV